MDPAQLAANLAALAPGGAPPADGAPPAAAAATTPPSPQPTPTPTAAPVPTVPLEQFTAIQSRLAELEKERADRETKAREIEINALKVKGDYEKVFNLQREQSQAELQAERTRLKDIEERAKRYALDRELALALASKPLVQGGAEHLTRLLRDDFSVAASGDSFVVQSKDFRSVNDYIGAMLGRPDYQCFIKPNNPGGGSGAVGTQAVQTGTLPPADAPPATFSDAVIAMAKAKAAAGNTNPQLDRTVPFGLRGLGPVKTH
jgi:hypothetical protein